MSTYGVSDTWIVSNHTWGNEKLRGIRRRAVRAVLGGGGGFHAMRLTQVAIVRGFNSDFAIVRELAGIR